MQSLNAGVELDNEVIDSQQEAGKELDKAMFKDVKPGEIPELKENVEIDTLVTKERGLSYMQNNLETIGGINQHFVLESMHLVPGLVTDECPLAFYSQDITKTRYNFAMEAICNEKKRVGQLIASHVPKAKTDVTEVIDKLLTEQGL